MHVIINLQPLLSPLTGIGHYTRELTLELLSRQQGDGLMLEGLTGRVREPLTADHPLLAGAGGEGAAEAQSPWWQLARRYLRNPLTRRAYRWLYTQRLRAGAAERDALYWEPNYILLPWRGRSVVTVHDLSHRRYPQYHPPERVAFFSRQLGESLARARRINVVSQFTAQELVELEGVDPARIDIVPPAVSSRFLVPLPPAGREALEARYRLPERYLLSVGTLEPRKNLSRVLEAYGRLPVAVQQRTPLLLAGMSGWGEQRLSAAAEAALARGTIRRLGYVPSADLPGLYARAAGFVYVSLYEGFGMPVAEAMASGTPVLTANVTATHEVAGGTALEVAPDDDDAILEGLRALIDDDHQERILAARARAEAFTWQASADRLLASFRQAMID